MQTRPIVVVGAGVAGLVTALELTARDLPVLVLERASTPGGKMREVTVGESRIDAGPTVFTMRSVFEEVFESAGTTMDAELRLHPVELLARHAWSADESLDLFADVDRSADAIAAFAGAAEGRRYLEFTERSRRIFRTLDRSFIRSSRPGLMALVARTRSLPDLLGLQPWSSLWQSLGDHFHDPRLRQLFGRYATYVGSSPFLAPATLMLIAHVEQNGVWLVEGGMHRVAQALARLASARGALFRYGAEVNGIELQAGRASAVTLADGERIPAAAVVVNADAAAIAGGRFGTEVVGAVAPVSVTRRSLSALTWTMLAKVEGFPLVHHSVFFSRDYAAEFDDLFQRSRLPVEPTVYICAQDRDDQTGQGPAGAERLLCLVNAPARGDSRPLSDDEIQQCRQRVDQRLEACGLHLQHRPEDSVTTGPAEFDRLFPATGGALYGQASHGWRSSLSRQGSRSRVPGLYLAGGSVHPGAGIPMAATSGRLAAACLLDDMGVR